MGSDADIYVFDYASYINEVVPAFRQLILTGRPESWLLELAENPRLVADVNLSLHADLRRYCTHLLPHDLAWNGIYEGSRLEWDWLPRTCQSTMCPERMRCPFHAINANGDAYQLLHLFEFAVAERCLGKFQFIGRSVDLYLYDDMLIRMGISANHRLRRLLFCLSRRGFVMGYQWANSDGIHGWLSPQETQELFGILDSMDLPRYEASFEAMEAFCPVWPGPYECPGVEWEALSLSFIRTVAQIACDDGKAILWGNDILFPADLEYD